MQQLLAYLQLPYEMEAEIVHLPKAALRRYVIMGWITSAVLAVPIIGAVYILNKISRYSLSYHYVLYLRYLHTRGIQVVVI